MISKTIGQYLEAKLFSIMREIVLDARHLGCRIGEYGYGSQIRRPLDSPVCISGADSLSSEDVPKGNPWAVICTTVSGPGPCL